MKIHYSIIGQFSGVECLLHATILLLYRFEFVNVTRFELKFRRSYLLNYADEADLAAGVHMVLAVTQDERLGYHDVQVNKVGHDACARGHLQSHATQHFKLLSSTQHHTHYMLSRACTMVRDQTVKDRFGGS